jgi:hypothetical protein
MASRKDTAIEGVVAGRFRRPYRIAPGDCGGRNADARSANFAAAGEPGLRIVPVWTAHPSRQAARRIIS